MGETGQQSPSRGEQAKQELIQPTIRVILALVVLAVIQFLVVQVPGVERTVLDPDITVATILYSVITLIMFGAIINYASATGAALASIFESFPAIERIVQLIGVLVVLIWAYQEFWWLPYFRENQTQYDYIFLILGIVFIGWLGYLLYSNVDKLSALLTGQVIKELSEEESSVGTADTEPETEITETTGLTESDDLITCPDCGADLPADASFCNSCGTDLTGETS